MMEKKELVEKILKEYRYRNEKRDKSVVEDFNKKKDISKLIDRYINKIDLAEQFLDMIPLFYDEKGLWWRWVNKKWKITDEIDILNLINNSSYINIINSKERTEILNALKQVSRARKPKKPKKTWIQFNDEVVDIETGERFEAKPEYFLTNPIPWDLGKEEETPMMDKIFKEWVGEKYVKTLYEIIAYSLLPDYPIHRIFCFIGGGMNGKSKYLELIRKFIGGENVTSTELDTLLNSRFEVTRLHKKLICQMGETNFNEMNKTSMLKKLSGGDLIGFEYKNKTPFEDINYAKILISTNNLPTTTDKTIGFYRRWLIIDFPNQFSEKKDILSEIPEKEYRNLALKSIGILIELLKNRKFHNEGSIEERIKKYEEKSNPLEKFWKENVKEDYENHIYKYDFRKKLNEWCKENRFREISDRTINHFMKEKGIETKQISAEWFSADGKKPIIRAWIGIKWKK